MRNSQLSAVTAAEQQLFSAIYKKHKHFLCHTFHRDCATQLPQLPHMPQMTNTHTIFVVAKRCISDVIIVCALI